MTPHLNPVFGGGLPNIACTVSKLVESSKLSNGWGGHDMVYQPSTIDTPPTEEHG